ncbi:MAG: methyl-accepting chemotaxis protein [Proteobacteria bacterium]|nr:methyl-accepting chemotaxis protein [Pseudomonadota bacterium]
MFSDIKIATQLKLLGAAMIVLTLLLVIVGYSMVTRVSLATDEMYNRGLVGSKLLADGNNAVWELRFGIANYTLATPENRKKILDTRPQLYATLEESLQKYAALGFSGEQDLALKELQAALQQYKAGAPKWFELIDAGKLEEAADYRAKVTNAAGSAMVKSIKAVIEKQLKVNEELEKSSQATTENAHKLLAAIGAITLLIVVASVILLGNAISQPLSQLQFGIEAVERSSDFTLRVSVAGDNEIGCTAESFNKLMSTMQASLRQLLDSVDLVTKAAATLSSSSGRVADGSTQQSEAINAIASTMEQITGSVGSVSDSARNALEISKDSGQLSNHGGEIIQQTVNEVLDIAKAIRQMSEVIGELGQQSNKISSVVQVIKDVADQTNLLALNAAIEAARAGEQGRGFAVVADEVRKLAERTTNSTAEITQMISTIQSSASIAVASMSTAVTKVDSGVVMAQQAGDAINQIKDRAIQVSRVVEGIASALAEQSNASNNAANHVESVARMTEINQVATEEIAAATHNLEKLAEAMRTVGSRFRI